MGKGAPIGGRIERGKSRAGMGKAKDWHADRLDWSALKGGEGLEHASL